MDGFVKFHQISHDRGGDAPLVYIRREQQLLQAGRIDRTAGYKPQEGFSIGQKADGLLVICNGNSNQSFLQTRYQKGGLLNGVWINFIGNS